MLVWEMDPSLRDNELGAAFADVWCAIPHAVLAAGSFTSGSLGGQGSLGGPGCV